MICKRLCKGMRGGCYIYLYLEFDLRKENEMISAQHAGKWQRWQSVPSRAGSGPTWQGQTKKCVLVVGSRLQDRT